MTDRTVMNGNNRLWKPEERCFVVELYLKKKSFAEISSSFKHKYKCEKTPARRTIYKWVTKFRNEATLQNLYKQYPGRKTPCGRPTLRSPEVKKVVRDSVEQSPKRSSRKRVQSLETPSKISRSTLLRIMKDDLKLFPYRIQTHQKLTATDKSKRLQMGTILMDKVEECQSFLPNLWTSDEAHFQLDGQVNSKNNVYWGSSVPNEVGEKPLHSAKVTVWVAMSSRKIIGPFFFESDSGDTVTVNSERYIEVLNKFWSQLEEIYPTTVHRQWFQQDGATPHTANNSIKWLEDHFKSRVVSRRCAMEWPPNSPDLSPPDFFLWGFLKDKVYSTKPRNILELKKRITDEIRAIKPAVLRDVMQNFTLRLKKCLERRGGHLEHMM